MGYKAFTNYLQSLNKQFDSGLNNVGLTEKGKPISTMFKYSDILNQQHQDIMANTSYQRATYDMQQAGLNPALMYGSGSPAPVSTSTMPNSNDIFNSIVQAMMLPAQLRQINANADAAKAQANLANENAKNVAQDTINKGVSEEQMRLNLKFDKDLYNVRKESFELGNSKQRIEIDVLKEHKNEIIANVNEIAQRTKNEEYKGWLIQAETRLKEAEEHQIRVMIPFEQALKSAQTQQARAAASLSTVQAAIQQGLLDGGYVDRQLRNLDAEFKKTLNSTQYEQVRTDLLNIQKDIQSGKAIDTSTIPDWRFTDKLAAEAWNSFIERMYEASQAITGPLAGILK